MLYKTASSRWLIKSPTMFHLCVARPRQISIWVWFSLLTALQEDLGPHFVVAASVNPWVRCVHKLYVFSWAIFKHGHGFLKHLPRSLPVSLKESSRLLSKATHCRWWVNKWKPLACQKSKHFLSVCNLPWWDILKYFVFSIYTISQLFV